MAARLALEGQHFSKMNLAATLIFVSLAVHCSTGHPQRRLPSSPVPPKLAPAQIKAVYVNASTDYKFMFPNIPVEEIDDNFFINLPIKRLNQQESLKHRLFQRISKPASSKPALSKSEAATAENQSYAEHRIREPVPSESSHDTEVLIQESNTIKKAFESTGHIFSELTKQDPTVQSSSALKSDSHLASLLSSLVPVIHDKESRVELDLSPEDMEEINETGRLCSEDGECIYFSGDWGNNCCPFG